MEPIYHGNDERHTHCNHTLAGNIRIQSRISMVYLSFKIFYATKEAQMPYLNCKHEDIVPNVVSKPS